MEKSNIFVMVSGPVASGKSTLADRMVSTLPAHFYKPSKAYIDLAKAKGIPIENAFQDVSVNEAGDYFCKICKEHPITIGDQHLSIQPIKDTAIAIGDTNQDFQDEPYVSAIDHTLFEKLDINKVRTLLIYLKASAEELYKRACQRNQETGMYIRNRTLDDVKAEVEAEEYYFNELIGKVNVDSHIIETSNITADEVLHNAVSRVRELGR